MTFSRLPVTFSLIAACLLAYLGLVSAPEEVFGLGALVPLLVAEGQAWRLVTSAFLHSGFVHLALNMLSLYFLGSFAEASFGRGRFLALYLISGIAGGLAYLYFGDFFGAAVGASGAIFGLLGGVFGFTIRQGSFSMQNPIIRQLLILTALNLFLGATIPNVSNTAHIGGLVGGLVYGFLLAPTVYSEKRLVVAAPVLIAFGIEVLLLVAWYLFVV